MGRLSGYGRRTVEQTRSIDINRLRRGGCAGGNRLQTGGWARNELYKVGFRPKHWNDDAITLDNQILDIRYISIGALAGGWPILPAHEASEYESCLARVVSNGVAGRVMA